MPHDHRPPRELWPDRLYTLPELQYPETLNVATELLGRHVREGRGDLVAIRADGRQITFAALESMVDRIARGLQRQGVEPGDRILLRLTNCPEFAAVWLAIQKIGAVAVATMPMLKARELAYILDDAEVQAVVAGAGLLDELRQALGRASARPLLVVAGDAAARDADHVPLESLVAGDAAGVEPAATPRDALALIAYTSGSTGTPKGACHSPSDILASADAYARHILAPTSDDRFGGHPTLAFTFGLGGLLVFPFRFGAGAVLLEKFTPERQLDLVQRERISVLFCAATSYRLLLQVPELERRYDLGSLRLCVSAGEPLPRAVYQEWLDRTGVEILDGLGSTEMFQIFVSGRPGRVRPGATGLPVPGYEVRIVDDGLRELPRGTSGLLAVRGPTGCRYWRKPDRQREYVRGGWNIPNDVCVQDEDGYIWYQCRNDDLIICAGYNIAGPEVEAVLLEHPAVLEAAVVASPDPLKGQVPKAFIVLKPGLTGSPELEAELQEHVRRELAPYKYPRRMAFVPSLPKTETGKIRRVELRQAEYA